MKTPKEKAKYLFSSYLYEFNEDFKNRWLAKQCALIAVDEVIENLVELSNGEFTFIHNVEYWQEVKQEIQNL
jgi:hypothetical protein